MDALPQKDWDAGMAMSFLGREICQPETKMRIVPDETRLSVLSECDKRSAGVVLLTHDSLRTTITPSLMISPDSFVPISIFHSSRLIM